MKEGILTALTAVFIVGLMALLMWGAVELQALKCRKLSEQTGIPAEYHPIGTRCAVYIDGSLIPYDVWVNNTGN